MTTLPASPFHTLRQTIRVLSALSPVREDWLLIEPEQGLEIPIPDFQRARRGRLSYHRKGLPSSKEERRLIGPRLLLFAIIFPVVQLPLWRDWTIISVSAARWRMLTVGQKFADLFAVNGHANPGAAWLVLYVIYVTILVVRIMLMQHKSRPAHYRIPRRDGTPLALRHITPQLVEQYLALGDSCYVVDRPDRCKLRYRQRGKTLLLHCDESLGTSGALAVFIDGSEKVWSEPAGEPINGARYSQIIARVRRATEFALYSPRFTCGAGYAVPVNCGSVRLHGKRDGDAIS